MELYPLPLPDLDRAVDRGEVRRVQHGPMTVERVLERARAEMDEQDERERQAAGPVAWARAHRPRHRLIDRLLYGKGR